MTDKWNRDLRGNEIRPGHQLAVAAQTGYSVVMRIGVVLELNEHKKKIKVDYHTSGGYSNPERPVWIEDVHRKSLLQ